MRPKLELKKFLSEVKINFVLDVNYGSVAEWRSTRLKV
jgi:hypothetical protein